MTPTIKAAIEKKRAASVASEIAHDAWEDASEAAREAETTAKSAHEALMAACVDLRNVVAAELGADVSEVETHRGDLWVCLDEREMTYDEAVVYLAKRGAIRDTDPEREI